MQNLAASHERHLGPVVVNVKSATLDIYDILPNPQQPRLGPKDDADLRKSILENGGLLQPVLVEPHPESEAKFRLVDGERRWFNCKILVEVDKRPEFRRLPAEVTDRPLSDEERLRAWVTIHMQRREWTAKEKERTAYRLIDLVGRVKAANILGVTVREVDKLKETYELSERMSALKNPDASITYAREIMNLPKYIRTKETVDAIVGKTNANLITSSKQIRDLRRILKDANARAIFLQQASSIEDAVRTLSHIPRNSAGGEGLEAEIERFNKIIITYPWTNIAKLRGNLRLVDKVRRSRQLLEDIEKMLAG